MKTFVDMCCGECGIEFKVPDHFKRERLETGKGWYCPNGHSRVFKETESDKYRREAERLKQQLAMKDDAIRYQKEAREAAERRASAARGQVTRLKNRAAAGVCPCCNRHFTNLERHMQGKHPDFAKEDNVVTLKTA